MAGKQVTELDALPSFTDNSLLPVHNGAGLKKGLLSQLANYLGTKFSNPNLLINPDFKINQRGSANYTSNGYTVDRWKINLGSVKPSTNGITVTLNNKGQFFQMFEKASSGTYTASIKITSITGDCVLFLGQHSVQLNKAGVFSITESGSINGVSLYKSTAGTCTINIEWIKLEQGPTATAFVAPNNVDELVKCQRYFIYLPSSMVGYRFTSQIFVQIEKINNMRENATIGITGSNNDTNVISTNSVKQNASINVGACKANVGSGSVGIYIDGIGTIQNTLVGIDFNSTKIFLDAEIY